MALARGGGTGAQMLLLLLLVLLLLRMALGAATARQHLRARYECLLYGVIVTVAGSLFRSPSTNATSYAVDGSATTTRRIEARQYLLKLLPEVIVQPGVQERIVAGR
uniref:Putative secreted protein n=1 Tax=Anopheles darlingi TaxID=43151 RepID=A0A2M4D677_ANODA